MELPRPLKRWSLALTGLALATVPAARLTVVTGPTTTVLQGAVPLLLLAGVTYAGWVYAGRESPTFTVIVTAWTLSVVAGMVVVALWIATLAHLVAANLSVLTLAPVVTSVGSLTGLWLGTNNARSREREARLRRQRQRGEFLNELLRHYVLNAAQVIVGQAEILADRTDEGGAETIARTGRRMARHVQQMRALVASEDDCWPVDLAAAVETAREGLPDDSGVHVVCEVADPCPVVADDALDVFVEALLVQAIDRAGGGDVSIRIATAREDGGVTVTVDDDAAGAVAEPLDPESVETTNGVFEFQRYLVSTLAERYGGRVTVRERDGGGRFEVWLPAPAREGAFGNS